jgi:hypothetical protein
VIGSDAHVRRSFVDHLRDRCEHTRHSAKWWISFFETTDSVEVPKQLVRAIEQVNNHLIRFP